MKAKNFREMSNSRYMELDRSGKGLTLEERQAGWHFCEEFDEGLTQGEQRHDDGTCAWCGFDGRKVNIDGKYEDT